MSVVEVGIQTTGHFQRLIAGINGGEHLLRRQKFQPREQRRIGQHQFFHAVDGAHQGFSAANQRFVLPAGDEIRPQEWT